MYYQRAYPETEFLVCPCSVDEITKENWKLTQHGIDEVLAEIKRIVSQFVNSKNNLGVSKKAEL